MLVLLLLLREILYLFIFFVMRLCKCAIFFQGRSMCISLKYKGVAVIFVAM